MPHYFTLQEANQTLETIRPLMERITTLRNSLLARRPDGEAMIVKARSNGGSKEASEIAWEFSQITALIARIEATGAVVKDINAGLVDFPALREGQPVYLCWQVGEAEIQYWHPLEGGFSSRQPW